MAANEERTAVANDAVAVRLEEIADLLESQHANPFRVRAYRGGAAAVRALDRPVRAILDEEGLPGLVALPGIGRSLARAIEALARDGRFGMLERLRGESAGEEVLATVPGLGPELAHRIHADLGIDTLHELEIAAHDGRLERVPGFGRRRVQAVAESLAGRFRRPRIAPAADAHAEPPPVAELLDVDREYRERADAGDLPRIAPRRFNPEREAWLPILHAKRGERNYTALFSNTARAHELGATRDWVVIYRDDADGDGQWTVITAQRGPRAGRRIVRGRERECDGPSLRGARRP